MQPTLEPRLVMLEAAPPTTVDTNAIKRLTKAQRIARVLAGMDPEEARVCLEGYSYEDFSSVSSWTCQQLAPHLENLGLTDEAYEVYEGLAWRHLNRGKSQYYHLAKQALAACRRIAYALADVDRYHDTMATIRNTHGHKRVIASMRG